jgi:poly(hydroxyalkanoate) granule-associated protein
MLKKARAQERGTNDAPQNLKDTSRQIWLAGLGAFSRAQSEGMKMFETLVEQGQNLEARTRRAATETAAAAAGAAAQKAKEMQAMAGGTWDKLEQVFEDRVAKALSKLGVYTQEDVARLAERVDALSEAVNALIKSNAGATGAPALRSRAKRQAQAAAQPKARASKSRKTAASKAKRANPATEPGAPAAPSSEAPKAMPSHRVPRKSRKAAKSA